MSEEKSRTYTITELSKEFDVTTRTIRFYEDKGLISPQREGQRRIYSPRDRVRLRLIMRGKRIGFALSEIQELIDLYDTDRSAVTQLEVLIDRIQQRRDALVRQQQDINAMLNELEVLEDQCASLLKDKKA
ncbi:MerR family transcriptional regulator [Candidatus Terasakiella magnetica]|uniref:MerR family transcriptional regulator n=1 Tax=Candidatus Terasakiella magnetica TaxID=1867952 RepID=A0A1C3RD80_9PROT|nr:MerR family DNA-binding transcriptional regulator [Candidatus Terasakiella magnetica]SCA55253.1 MerR family transcriptional regulator [Candidatus Terasakiella magnetica]